MKEQNLQSPKADLESENFSLICKSSETLTEYLKHKAENHNHFKHYAPMCRVLSICEKKALCLNTGSAWNDTKDRSRFNGSMETVVNFGKCFSYSSEENVAMWMLYGGINGNGGMIDFTKKGMHSILHTKTVDLGTFVNGEFVKFGELQAPNFQIYLTDIVYYSIQGKKCCVSRSDEQAKNVALEVVQSMGPQAKVFPWRYENECRLIVSVAQGLLPKNCDCIRIPLDDLSLGKSLQRIYTAPNYKGTVPPQSIPSKLAGEINWDLCQNCKGPHQP